MGNSICCVAEKDDKTYKMTRFHLPLQDEDTVIHYIDQQIKKYEEKANKHRKANDTSMYALQESRIHHLRELRSEVLQNIEEQDAEALALIAHKLGDGVADRLLERMETRHPPRYYEIV